MNRFGRVLRTGLSSLRDRARSGLAAARINPSRMAAFIGLAVLTGAYGVLLIGYTITLIGAPLGFLGSLASLAIQTALLWTFLCLGLLAAAVRPY